MVLDRVAGRDAHDRLAAHHYGSIWQEVCSNQEASWCQRQESSTCS
eukprot:COSAG01_NODE_68153_length_265_cov_0.548193_1_plen_45_part_10